MAKQHPRADHFVDRHPRGEGEQYPTSGYFRIDNRPMDVRPAVETSAQGGGGWLLSLTIGAMLLLALWLLFG